ATVVEFDPTASARLSDRLSALQLFMGVVGITLLCLGAVARERDRSAQARDQAIRARDEFLAIASHELRTPLTSLDLQVSNLRELLERGDGATDTLLAKLRVIERQGDRLGALVENLLDV